MYILCGNRRIHVTRYNYMIQKKFTIQKTTTKHNKGDTYWSEDPPAFPSTLGQALQMVWERELAETGDCEPSELIQHMQEAKKWMDSYIKEMRKDVFISPGKFLDMRGLQKPMKP